MKVLTVGDPLPDITFNCTDPNLHSFKELLGKNIVLYFYPKDNTYYCSLQGKDFAQLNAQFSQLNTCIIGVSQDGLRCHQDFKTKLSLPFPLISDRRGNVSRYFHAHEKHFLLRHFIKTKRKTFLIDQTGVIRHVWPKVKAKGHAEEVLAMVRSTTQVT